MVKQFLRFVIPSITSMVIFNMYTLVDGIFVAHFVNDTALAAINVATPYITSIFSIAVLFAVGSGTVISIYRGEQNEGMMHRVFSMNILLVSLLAISVSIGSVLCTEWITHLLGANEDVYSYVCTYVRIIASFAFFYIVAYCFEVLLKADGYPQKSIVGVCIGACSNIALDALLLGVFHMGLSGAALATGIAQAATFLYFLSHFIGNRKSHFHFIKGPYPWKEYRRILPLGLAECVCELSPGIMILVFNHRINELLSTPGLVTFSILMYVYNLVLMAMSGVSQGTQPLISYYYGKKDSKAVHTIHRYARVTVCILSLVLFLIVEFAAGPIAASFVSSNSKEYIMSIQALRQFALVFLLLGHVVITAGILNAVEKPKLSFLLSLLRGIFMIIASLYVCTWLWGSKGIWISPVISEILCFGIALKFLHDYQNDHQTNKA